MQIFLKIKNIIVKTYLRIFMELFWSVWYQFTVR